MSGVLDLSHPLQAIAGLLGAGSSNGSTSSPASSNASSSAQPVTATSAQNTTSTTSTSKASSGPAATPSSSSTGVGGDPITAQAQPLDVTLQTPKDDTAQPQVVTPSKNTNYVVAVPSTGVRPVPFEQTSQGWMVFGVAWYWWAILVMGVAAAAILVNRFLAEHAKLTELIPEKGMRRFKQFLRL